MKMCIQSVGGRMGRRDLLSGAAAAAIVTTLPGSAMSGPSISVETFAIDAATQLSVPGFTRPVVFMSCDDVSAVANFYRQICGTLDDARLDQIEVQFKHAVNNELARMQRSIDVNDSAVLGEYLALANKAVALVIVGFTLFATGEIAAIAAAADVVYAIGIAPTVDVIAELLKSGDGADIFMAATGGRLYALALNEAEKLDEFFFKYADAVKSLFEIGSGAAEISRLQQAIDDLGGAAAELSDGLQKLLTDRDLMRQTICRGADFTAAALDSFRRANARTNCRLPGAQLVLLTAPTIPLP